MPELATILHPIQPNWSNRYQYPKCLVPSQWAHWLYDAGSLTLKLSALNPGTFNVQLLREYYGQPTPIEQQELALAANETIWAREVVLRLEQTPLVYARTAVPLRTLKGGYQQLQGLGTRSLGSFLFAQPHLKRGPLRINRCAANDLSLDWCRRSVFMLNQQQLMVTEAFNLQLEHYPL